MSPPGPRRCSRIAEQHRIVAKVDALSHADERREHQEAIARLQAVERLRLVNAHQPKRVILACKVPVPGLPVSRLVRWDDLKPFRLSAAMAEAAQGRKAALRRNSVEFQLCDSAANPAARSRSRNSCIFTASRSGMRSASEIEISGSTARQASAAARACSGRPRAT
jgi:hypothetical protein